MFKILMLTLVIAIIISSIASVPLYINVIVSFVIAVIVIASHGGRGL